jgi:hypothetical protein
MERSDDLNPEISLIAVFGVMALIGYCVISCIQRLILRIIETALIKQNPASHQLLSTAEIESNKIK